MFCLCSFLLSLSRCFFGDDFAAGSTLPQVLILVVNLFFGAGSPRFPPAYIHGCPLSSTCIQLSHPPVQGGRAPDDTDTELSTDLTGVDCLLLQAEKASSFRNTRRTHLTSQERDLCPGSRSTSFRTTHRHGGRFFRPHARQRMFLLVAQPQASNPTYP